MPEFNNIRQELNDGEKFALVCGMIAGMRLQDKTRPPSKVTVNLEPISVNGLGGIGLMSPDIEYTGTNKIVIPVSTHDVDREYSGFSLSVSYDASRIAINSISEGDFGPLQGTSIKNGKAYTRCMLGPGEFRKDESIVCYLNCTIIGRPTKGNSIVLTFNNSTGYDPNYCTMLTWVLNDIDGQYYSYFITPTVNKGCEIYSEEEGFNHSVSSNITDTQQISAQGSPSTIAMGTAYIKPGNQGLVPIYTNSNVLDNMLYNKFVLKAKIEGKWLGILKDIEVVGDGEWTLAYNRYIDDNGDLILDIIGTRAENKMGNSTTGFIRFELDSKAEAIDCEIENLSSELITNGSVLNAYKGNGYIYYTELSSGPSFPGGPAFPGGPGGPGGFIGRGTIYSGSSQTIWVDLGNGNRYPVQLNPGYNDVHIYIPNIKPEDMWEETTPTIEAPGYILIPGGFTWETIIKDGAPLGLSSPRILDKYSFKDVYRVLKEEVIPPIDVDNILDNIKFVDIIRNDLIKTITEDMNISSSFELVDFLSNELQRGPVTIEKDDLLDEIEYKDLNSNEIKRGPIRIESMQEDEFEFNDFTQSRLESKFGKTYISDQDSHIEMVDIAINTTLNVNISESSDNNDIESIEDFVNIYLERKEN